MPKETFFNLDNDKRQRIIDSSVREFATYSYDEVKLSSIIKSAGIPRGSFYQYFVDKSDLYKYLFTHITNAKLEYLEDLLINPEKLSFLDLFRELYIRGASFALNHPLYVSMMGQLLSSKGQMYDELLKDALDKGLQYYINYIEEDKRLGKINPEINSHVLAKLVVDMTTNVALDELNENSKTIDLKKMTKRIEDIILIFKKGILKGE
ncbi:TetR/AcrR family transcriptional regulator [Candidatus Izimaplasma bacterium ZiA1]|uniref:TetR/AcrR family transcriptional regulator n=1 Tax=Candidatus Izimoplasma sp. ZiA1 TaxID=2024899 RepID=UPI00143C95D4